MNLNDYQEAARLTANYDDPFYPIASLMVEAAELSDLFIKPLLRGDDVEIREDSVLSEAGDVLWNLAMILDDKGLTLQEAAEYNIYKLEDRAKRGVLRGSGGNR